MKAHVYWIEGPWPGRLGILPRPRGGDWLDDEVRSWRAAGVDVVVSLLVPEEVLEFDIESEGEACRKCGIEFHGLPIPDRGIPASQQDALKLAERLHEYLRAGLNVGIHCRQGIGRSGLLAGAVLILSGIAPEHAIQRLSQARGCAVPETAEQRHWLTGLSVPAPADAASDECPYSPEELRRMRDDPQGRTLEEIWRSLGVSGRR